jgi:hypothetical protein
MDLSSMGLAMDHEATDYNDPDLGLQRLKK